MKNRTLLVYIVVLITGTLSGSLQAGKKSKKVSIKSLVKGKEVVRYWVKEDNCRKKPEVITPVALIDLLEDIIELQPKAGGYALTSKHHYYYIICMSQAQTPMHKPQIMKLLVKKSLFIIPAVGAVIGTIDGATYKLESVERVKATLKNPEQIELVLSITY
jgi:hypothetical protein